MSIILATKEAEFRRIKGKQFASSYLEKTHHKKEWLMV
jgi:hypothetical protein